MKSLALAAALAAVLASAASAQDPAPKPDPKPEPKQDGGAAPPVAPAQDTAVKDPSKPVGGRIEEALKGVFSSSAAGRLAARALLDAAVADWAGEVKADPLRAVKYWRTVLGGTLPTGTRRAGISQEKFTYIEGREATLWVSIPKTYGPKVLSPMVLVILDKSEDPRRALPAMYGECLKDWVVVAISADPKEAGIDVLKEPWLAALGLRFAADNLRVDRDRVVLDSTGSAANLSLSQGSEWAVQFAGCILRAPTISSPLVSNLALGSVLLLTSEPATDGQKKVVEDVRTAVPPAVLAPSGKGEAEAVQKWLGSMAPRRITAAANGTFAWKTRPQGGEPWAYWLWVFRAADNRKERLVDVHLVRDPAGSAIDIQSDNLAEGILLLNDEVINLERDVAIRVNGREVWKGRPERLVRTALYWIGQTGERTLFAPAEVRFTVPADLQSPKKGAPPPGGADGAPPPPPPPPPPAPGSGDGGDDKGGEKDGDKGEKKDGDKGEKKDGDKGDKKGDDTGGG